MTEVNQDKLELVRRLQELEKQKEYLDKYRKIDKFKPYAFQKEFFDAGAKHDQRFLMAGNRVGKTFSMAAEVSYHLTGIYPDWWEGHRFDKPILLWAVGITGESTRTVMQKELFGTAECKDIEALGTGSIPRDCIVFDQIERDGNQIKSAKILHVSGEYSTIAFKSTAQGAHVLMGATLDFIWLDEEDPHNSDEIYSQCLTRTATTKGHIVMTATPENGRTPLIDRYLTDTTGTLYLKKAGWNDVDHLDDDTVKKLLAGVSKQEIPMRMYGEPLVSEGMVYGLDVDGGLYSLLCEPIDIPSHWKRVAGLDIGITHKTAVVWSAYDAESDTIYIYDTYAREGETPAYHAPAINARGGWIPVILPHDADNAERGSGSCVRKFYEDANVNVQRDTFYNNFELTDGKQNNFVQIGITDILQRMNTGRFKIFDTPNNKPLMDELNNYQYKNGKIHKVGDDIVDAMRYSAGSVRHRGLAPDFEEKQCLRRMRRQERRKNLAKW